MSTEGLSMTMRPLLVLLATLAAIAMAGCGALEDGKVAEQDRPVVALVVDISGSTKDLRDGSTGFVAAANDTLTQAAVAQSSFWASAADYNTVADGKWEIDEEFTPSVNGSSTLVDGEMTKKAQEVEPKVRQLAQRRGGVGSDLLGALQMSARLFDDYPDRPHELVMLTDGGVNVKDFKLTSVPPPSDTDISAAVKTLGSEGELPDLSGASVWIGGLGQGMGRENAQATIDFWNQMIPETGATLQAADGTLRLVDFPEGS